MRIPPAPIILGVNVVLTVVAQSLLRAGMSGMNDTADAPPLRIAWRVANNGYVIAGIVSFGVSLALWLALLSRLRLSALYPIQQSLVFLGIQFVAWRWLGEGFSLIRLTGVIVICAGVYLVARG